MRHLAALAPLAVALVAAGCGAAPGDDAPADPPGEDAAPAPATELEIVVFPDGEAAGGEVRYTLTCDPPGGDHPDSEAACAALAEHGAEAFEPVPPEVLCTQIYGGPQEARVRGTVDGERVDARFKRTDGCEIARWDRLQAVLGEADGGATVDTVDR
jgi:hypothetical protein